MLGINNGFVPADDGVHILKKHDPWKYRMGKAGFLSFFVVLAEISSSVKEFFRNEGGHDAHGVPAKADGFARGAGSCRPFLQGIFERKARGIESAISIFSTAPHIDGNARRQVHRTHLPARHSANKGHTPR
jgi:hypothetical protein